MGLERSWPLSPRPSQVKGRLGFGVLGVRQLKALSYRTLSKWRRFGVYIGPKVHGEANARISCSANGRSENLSGLGFTGSSGEAK